MSIIVDGNKIAVSIKNELLKKMDNNGSSKKLAIFYVGNNKVIDNFINFKKKFGESINVPVNVFRYPENISEDFLIKEIQKESQVYDGVIIQLPLPDTFDRKNILDSVPSDKDVDVLGSVRYKEFLTGDTSMMPPVASAVSEIFSFHGVDLNNKNIVVVGDGILVGKPVCDWLSLIGLKPSIITKDTDNKDEILKSADIVISGVGLKHFINKDQLKDGVILVDAGSSSHNGSIYGDISPDCKEKASIFSAVPGGVGPITIASLFKNLLYN